MFYYPRGSGVLQPNECNSLSPPLRNHALHMVTPADDQVSLYDNDNYPRYSVHYLLICSFSTNHACYAFN